ncbi:hypothetical protein PCANC_08629 [Puccinia coronata f. sp. avenae]|uniref:Ribosome biogenesis protein NSA2 homolog n=1 Tax=Puccinia coronata f. sp. avenae TaxID=200324 RepID=A0A2N5TC49_9BASI|nr:hypothetical protein PCANC_27167 [Puccinia coronata f. sp. avenae]PLW23052.1 hypothetical protein PCASD_11025 [Puccinia coronata f. sp. avenae]PLW42171.1 hypothetical protein PCASD_05580 [Puccinia coronata f. sp. avenae]PLW42521.1 hypothetical protein PCANC_08629 [Puccinia coronata f. sp. avenae]
MPQGEYIEEFQKRSGKRLDHEERKRKREAREVHKRSSVSQSMHGHKAKLLHARRYSEKVEMKKRIREHEKKDVKTKSSSGDDGAGALPTYLLDREKENKAKALSSALKEKRKEKAGKYSVPLPKVRGLAEDEVFKVMKTGKRKQKAWKRMVTKATFVPENFTRKPVKMERFIRPMGLRVKKANITHPELQATFQLPIIGVKKNPQSPMYTQLGVLTKGTVIEVNVSELGLVTTGGKVVWAKYAQVTNNPELDGCVNGVLLV